ncbi:MAG TPA: pyrroline-5-carboxylate reductase [Accumulibacter sp.]|nr:pyrroline-5-carboxylate reductase [Accumulibacter sp.]HMW16302.1 pyrroline-5-carboxylate reductase [Accumulibacter sp.]HMX22556.1 pyrroline-5-carboxylate reductase [Accumulibacter sp.]HMY05714.1 pyrroline-5-carboxylate reductase [Accumulibacter sp.]HNC16935.1 pyrroline-5-carboxylate reductase [Accumulibacter sp.]
MRITFLGGGNMANALIGGLLKTGFAASDIAVIELGAQGRAKLRLVYGVRCYETPTAAALDCDALLLSVKPQQMREACATLPELLRQQLVISIAAGLRLADLSRWLGDYTKIVRAMPNTPALIGAGITGLCAMPAVSMAERLGAERILQAVGSTLWIAEEDQMDAVTAVSGSGPAYVFLFIEALQQGARELGLSPVQARQLSIDTVLGAARLAAQSDEAAAVLRERVTSKGGTTEAALRTMAERGVKEGFIAGIIAANARGRQLGEQLGKDD